MKFCLKCGCQISENAKFCASCGEPVNIPGNMVVGNVDNNGQVYSQEGQYQQTVAYQKPKKKVNAFAIVSLVVGLVAILLDWFTFGIPSMIAIVFGIIGLVLDRDQYDGRGMAIAGLVLGIIFLVIFFLFFFVLASVLGLGLGLAGLGSLSYYL